MQRRYSPPSSGERRQNRSSPPSFYPKNGCCRRCMKAFSYSGKSCLCQVPLRDRNAELNPKGCLICGCHGCSPQDKPVQQRHSEYRPDKSYSRDRSYDSSRGESVDDKSFENVNQSLLGKVVIMEYSMEPAMLGLGIPQRTPNYILGRPL